MSSAKEKLLNLFWESWGGVKQKFLRLLGVADISLCESLNMLPQALS